MLLEICIEIIGLGMVPIQGVFPIGRQTDQPNDCPIRWPAGQPLTHVCKLLRWRSGRWRWNVMLLHGDRV